MNTIFGMQIIESTHVQPVPKLQLPHDFNACSPEAKASFNRWLLDRFGTKDVAYVIGGQLIIHPRHAKMLRHSSTLYHDR